MSPREWQSLGTGRWDWPGYQWLVTWRDLKADPTMPAADLHTRCVPTERFVGQMVLAIEKSKTVELVSVRKRRVPAFSIVWLEPPAREDNGEQLTIWNAIEDASP